MPNNKFNVNVELKIPEVSHLRLSLKLKNALFSSNNDVDVAVADGLKNYLQSNPLGENPASTLISSFSSVVLPILETADDKKNE